MQTVDWEDDNVPPVFPLDDKRCYFYDRPVDYAFDEGDQIVHLSEVGPTVFRVVDVMPYYADEEDYYSERAMADFTQVTIERVAGERHYGLCVDDSISNDCRI